MNRATERLSELKDKGLITKEQYGELLAALGTVENELPQIPEVPRLPVEPAVTTAPVRPVAPVSSLQVTDGSLTVRLISEDLQVRGVQGLPAVRVVRGQSSVRFRQSGNHVEVESGLTAGEFHGFSFSFGFGSDGDPVELEVPADMPCELKTVSGDITVSNLKGEVVVRSVSGDIDASSMTRLMSAQSTSGDVDLDQCLVDGDILSKSGDVDIRNSTVRGMIKSYSGDVSILNAVLNDTDVLSFSGDVSLEGVTVQGGARLKTTSGNVSAELDQHDVMVDVETRSGEATVRGPGVDVEVQRQRIPVGLATVELSVRTGSGDIEVRLT
ncbi:MAG: DUF4097 family beta strand repeat-containing protein [Caldiserica bacterium]|nr:DUF4097 family beta strand repeat-containing protein [Caldisericota bacterium]